MNTILVRHKWEPYLWLLPSILIMTIFVVFPIGIVFKLAFSEISKAGIVGGFVAWPISRTRFPIPSSARS